jgi:predicted phage baseplate assembly protein
VTTNEVTFGDGVHGMLPPKGDRNIVARSYRVGGGVEGNVPASSITVLKKSLGFVDDVSNPFPAAGGADLEDIEDIKRRGPYAIKSRDRAVTREDYEWLAIQSSNSVARANCIPGYQREGEVSVVIVPKVTASHPDFMKKPVPTTELLRRVNSCLSERKLLTTVLRVVKPQYRELSAEIEIMRLSSGSADRVKREIEKRLRLFLHPLKGGRDERGWPFGRNVFKVDLYHVVEEVEGVDFVSNISIFDEDSKVEVEQILVKEDMLPFLVNVEVTEKAHEMSL